MNATAHEPLKGSRPKLKQIFPTVSPRSGQVSKVMSSKVKVTVNVFQKCIFKWHRHTHRHFATDVYLLQFMYTLYVALLKQKLKI